MSTLGNWVKIKGSNDSIPCQTAVIACCVGGHIPALSYLFTERGADLRMAGIHMRLLAHLVFNLFIVPALIGWC